MKAFLLVLVYCIHISIFDQSTPLAITVWMRKHIPEISVFQVNVEENYNKIERPTHGEVMI